VTDSVDASASGSRPRALLLYYSYTGQSLKVLAAAGEVLSARGFDVQKAAIEFTDPRYSERFSRFPMRHVWRDMFRVLPAQTRRARGKIGTPLEATTGDYDLICIGSPTWWRTASMPVRSFLQSEDARTLLAGKQFAVFVVCRRYWRENLNSVRKMATKQGGQYAGEIHFTYPGSQILSILSQTSYLGTGEHRERYLGVPIPPTNIQPEQLGRAREFAAELADRVSTRRVR
jgi:menaquinone-dependent protoporphyrinogen IX oxidase